MSAFPRLISGKLGRLGVEAVMVDYAIEDANGRRPAAPSSEAVDLYYVLLRR
jgi:hypothetical protein